MSKPARREQSWADGRRKTTNAGQHREGEAGASTLVARSLCRPSCGGKWMDDGRRRKTLCPISSLFRDKLDMEQWALERVA